MALWNFLLLFCTGNVLLFKISVRNWYCSYYGSGHQCFNKNDLWILAHVWADYQKVRIWNIGRTSSRTFWKAYHWVRVCWLFADVTALCDDSFCLVSGIIEIWQLLHFWKFFHSISFQDYWFDVGNVDLFPSRNRGSGSSSYLKLSWLPGKYSQLLSDISLTQSFETSSKFWSQIRVCSSKPCFIWYFIGTASS